MAEATERAGALEGVELAVRRFDMRVAAADAGLEPVRLRLGRRADALIRHVAFAALVVVDRAAYLGSADDADLAVHADVGVVSVGVFAVGAVHARADVPTGRAEVAAGRGAGHLEAFGGLLVVALDLAADEAREGWNVELGASRHADVAVGVLRDVGTEVRQRTPVDADVGADVEAAVGIAAT